MRSAWRFCVATPCASEARPDADLDLAGVDLGQGDPGGSASCGVSDGFQIQPARGVDLIPAVCAIAWCPGGKRAAVWETIPARQRSRCPHQVVGALTMTCLVNRSGVRRGSRAPGEYRVSPREAGLIR